MGVAVDDRPRCLCCEERREEGGGEGRREEGRGCRTSDVYPVIGPDSTRGRNG